MQAPPSGAGGQEYKLWCAPRPVPEEQPSSRRCRPSWWCLQRTFSSHCSSSSIFHFLHLTHFGLGRASPPSWYTAPPPILLPLLLQAAAALVSRSCARCAPGLGWRRGGSSGVRICVFRVGGVRHVVCGFGDYRRGLPLCGRWGLTVLRVFVGPSAHGSAVRFLVSALGIANGSVLCSLSCNRLSWGHGSWLFLLLVCGGTCPLAFGIVTPGTAL